MSKNFYYESVGIDIKDLSKITYMFKNHPGTIYKLFSENEISDCQSSENKFTTLVIKYTIKEAIIKSLGKSGSTVPLNEIEIFSDAMSQFRVFFSSYWENKLFPGKKITFKLSVNISGDFVIAQVAIQAKRVLSRRFVKKNSTPPLAINKQRLI